MLTVANELEMLQYVGCWNLLSVVIRSYLRRSVQGHLREFIFCHKA